MSVRLADGVKTTAHSLECPGMQLAALVICGRNERLWRLGLSTAIVVDHSKVLPFFRLRIHRLHRPKQSATYCSQFFSPGSLW